MTIGIYCLRFEGTDRVYVGQSVNIEHRYKAHLSNIKTSKHINSKIQEAYHIYGTPKLEILCICGLGELNHMEEFYISKLDAFTQGFNLLQHSKIGDNTGDSNGNAKNSNNDIIKVLDLLVDNTYSMKHISDITKVSLGVVRSIANLITHRWLEEVFPDKYALLTKLKGTRSRTSSFKRMGLLCPVLIDPTGNKHVVDNITKFAETHNLDKSALCKVINGVRKTHKNWKLI